MYKLYPEEKFYTIQELEEHLGFKYLPQITFETPQERLDVLTKGLEKHKKNEVTPEAQELGSRFSREIEASSIPSVSIHWINDQVGYGIFAEEDLEIGRYAGEYTGIVRKNDRRYTEPLNNYCYEYPVLDSIGRSFVTDATHGNLTRFINHSFTPNLKPIHAFHKGFYHLIFLTIQSISSGTQLTYNYGKSYWYLRNPPLNL